MSKLIVSSIETQNIKFDSDTTAFTIGSDGGIKAEGTNTTSLQNGLAKVWCAYRGNGEALNDSLNVSGFLFAASKIVTVKIIPPITRL